MSLEIALRALKIGPGDEVITTPFTWISSAETISLVGATPVFVDIDIQTYNLDPELLESRIDRHEFVDRTLELDFVAMPYKAEHYSDSPSGILLDAIVYGKFILVTPYPTVENLLHRFERLGFIAPLNDWDQALQQFVRNTPLETYGQCEFLQKVADSRSHETFARSFLSQVFETN
jgi:hypothetical protein